MPRGFRPSEIAIAVILVLGSVAVAETCQMLRPDEEPALTAYVLAKYKFPETSKLEIRDTSFVAGTCYQKVVFVSDSPKRAVQLFLSPDHRFLAPALFDLKADPNPAPPVQGEEAMKLLLADPSPSRGRKDAPVTIVVFSDFE